MIGIVEPRLQFRSLAEEIVLAALDLADPANPIAIEIARLVSDGKAGGHDDRDIWVGSLDLRPI